MASPPTAPPPGPPTSSIGLAGGARAPRADRAPLVVAALVPITAGLLLLVAARPLGYHPSFLPAFLVVVIGCDLLTGLLLGEQYRAGAPPRTLALSWAYTWSGVLGLVYGTTFPGVVRVDGLPGSTPDTAAWAWALWHVGFVLLLAVALMPWPRRWTTRWAEPRHRVRRMTTSHLVVLGVAALATLALTLGSARVPVVIVGDDYSAMTETYGVWFALVLAVATGAALLGLRRPTGADAPLGTPQETTVVRWALVALLATLGDVAVSLLALGRYTVGWYGARALALVAAMVVLGAMLSQVARLHQQVRTSTAQLAAQNADLLEARAVREHLVAVISHDLRAPISGLRGYLELLEDHDLPPERLHHMVGRSQQLARRLTLMTEDLLTMAVTRDGALPLAPRRLDVREALDEAASGLPERDVRVHCEPGLEVLADPVRLQQVLDNLLTNADKYGAAPIVLGGRRQGAHTLLEVADAGPGVPAPLRERVFERYTRGQHLAVPGAGLGLSVVRDLVDAHGGRVDYDAARRCFAVLLPGPVEAAPTTPLGEHSGEPGLGSVAAKRD